MNDPYQHIKGWYETEDDQVKKWISEIVTNIRSGKYSPSLYPQLTREFVDMQSYGLFTDETRAALNAMAEQLKASKKDQIDIYSPERYLLEGDSARIYREWMNRYQEIIIEKENQTRKGIYQKIISGEDNDWIEEILEVTKDEKVVEGWSFLYWLEPKDVLRRLKECNNAQLQRFRFLFSSTYSSSVYYEHFPDDYDHLIEFKKLLKNVDMSGFGEIKKQAFKWIERDAERALRRFVAYEHDPEIDDRM